MKSLITAFSLIIAAACSASEHTFTFSGLILTDNSAISPYLSSGNTYSLAVNYNSDTPASHVFGDAQTTFPLESATLTINHGGALVLVSSNALNEVIISRGFFSSPPDGYQFFLYFPGALGFSQMTVAAEITGNFGTNYFSSALSLPLDALQTVNYSKSTFLLNSTLPTQIVQTSGRVTASSDFIAVPEPSSYAGIAAGVMLIACLVKRSRAQGGKAPFHIGG